MEIAIQTPKWGQVTLLRQTSQFSGCIGITKYLVGKFSRGSTNFFLVDNPEHCLLAEVPVEKLVFICMENPQIWMPSIDFLAKCGTVIAPFNLGSLIPRHVRFIRSYPCVPWFYGIEFCVNSGLLHKPVRSQLELDAMTSMTYPPKTKLLSMIASGKAGTPGHAWRRDLAIAVKSYFGDLVDIFGFGHMPIPDKRHAIDPYVFSIVIENDEADYYVTEKVVDCLIGWAIPIYSGARQLDSLLQYKVPRIPFGCSVDHALSCIKAAVSSGGMPLEQLAQIRSIAMQRLNLFEELPRLLLIS